MKGFVHSERQYRVGIGDELIEGIADEVDRLGCSRALVIATPGRSEQVDEVVAALGNRLASVFNEAVQHVPRESVDSAWHQFQHAGADCCIAVGGGSPTGLAKAIALEVDGGIPIIAMPTTYSGSESTNIYGISEGGGKTTGRDERVAPDTVLYIPRWTTGLPVGLSMASGVNALAHCVEALYAVAATPLTTVLAAEGIRRLAHALPGIESNPEDLDSRKEALWGAFLAGKALDGASMGLHHKLCHVLGGSFGLPHANVHAVVLPYAAAYNAEAAPAAMNTISRMLNPDDDNPHQSGPEALYRLNRRIGIPESLSALGLKKDDLAQVVHEVLQKEYPNPRPITRPALLATLEDALAGHPPQTHGS